MKGLPSSESDLVNFLLLLLFFSFPLVFLSTFHHGSSILTWSQRRHSIIVLGLGRTGASSGGQSHNPCDGGDCATIFTVRAQHVDDRLGDLELEWPAMATTRC